MCAKTVSCVSFALFNLILFNGFPVLVNGSPAKHIFKSKTLSTPPEIRITKWMADADRDYLDVGDYSDIVDSEWNEKVDTAEIQISGFGSQEFLISQHVGAVYIECHAQYPVEWVFHNSKYVIDDLHGIWMKTYRRSDSVTDPTSNVFIASLQILTQSNRATGNYTCRNTSPRYTDLSKDIFIFWEGSSPPYLVLTGKMLEIELDSNDTSGSVTIPCYVSHPKTSIQLLKDVDGEYKTVRQNWMVSTNFDPKLGFVLTYQNFSDVIGRYRCLSEEDENDGGLMEVVVKKWSSYSCEGNGCLHRQLLPGTRFDFEKTTEEIVCCSKGTTKPPRLHTLYCQNPAMCRMYEPGMFLTSGNNGKRSRNDSCVTEKLYPRDFGLVRCIGSGIDVFSYVYTEFWTPDQEYLRAVFDWRDLYPEKMIHVIIHSSAPYYNGQTVTATCQTLHSYFSDGIKWGIKWHNGTISYFDSLLSTETDARLHGIRSTFLKLNFDLAELICFAPVWNSTAWVRKSLKLEVRPAQHPVISGNSVEELTFALNETEKILECVSNAEPPAKVKWTRNDEDIRKNMVIWNQNGTSVLLFKTVTYETHGVYRCLAKNEVGQAVKIFRIFVEDTRHTTWSTAFAIVIPILVVTFIGIFAFLLWKMKLQKNVVTHLTRVVFRETNNT